jgi:hypothetical protein
MNRRGLDRVSLVAGISVLAIGALLIVDQSGDVDVSAGVLAAALVGVAGLIMLVSGLIDR